MSTEKTAGEPKHDGATTAKKDRPTPSRRRASGSTSEDQVIQSVTQITRHDGAITAKKDRPTPSRRKVEEEEEQDEGNVVTRTGSGILEYLQGVQSELKKVAWPTREDARRLTTIVLVALVAASLLLGTISLGFTELFRLGLDSPLLIFGVMFIAVAGGIYVDRRNRSKSTAL